MARRQTSHFVFYNPAYMKIGYPMGDVPAYFGVCTDVVVRAYRALGIDLQVLVHKSGAGSGDTNIDHRRVEVLRRSSPCRHQPADHRQSGRLQAGRHRHLLHAERLALQDPHRHRLRREERRRGVPLIVHNRGWGVQAEDWLFAEKITGHFRYAGPR